MEPKIPPVEHMDKAVENADAVVTASRLNVEMILESHAEERQQAEERHSRDMEAMRKHYTRIIFGLLLTLFILVGSAFAGLVYLMLNYDIGIATYQDLDASGYGTSIIEDGIHYNRD